MILRAVTVASLIIGLGSSIDGQPLERSVEMPLIRTTAVSIEPSLGYNLGHTTYDMILFNPNAGQDTVSYLRSKLEFPVNQFMVGGAVKLQSYLGGVEDWTLMLTGGVSVTDPGGTMYDTDWITVVGGYDGIFSYTESSAEGSNLILNFQFTKRLFGKSRHVLGVVAGCRYQRIKQDVDNFAGWRIPYDEPNPLRDTLDYENVPALEYRVTYIMPQAGLHVASRPTPTLSIDARALYGLTLADDYDDHILRNKEATADGRGNAFHGILRADWLLRERRPGSRPFFGVEAEIVTLKVDGDQKQFWYDDELTPDGVIVKGTAISGLPHEFISTQFRVGARFGFRF